MLKNLLPAPIRSTSVAKRIFGTDLTNVSGIIDSSRSTQNNNLKIPQNEAKVMLLLYPFLLDFLPFTVDNQKTLTVTFHWQESDISSKEISIGIIAEFFRLAYFNSALN